MSVPGAFPPSGGSEDHPKKPVLKKKPSTPQMVLRKSHLEENPQGPLPGSREISPLPSPKKQSVSPCASTATVVKLQEEKEHQKLQEIETQIQEYEQELAKAESPQSGSSTPISAKEGPGVTQETEIESLKNGKKEETTELFTADGALEKSLGTLFQNHGQDQAISFDHWTALVEYRDENEGSTLFYTEPTENLQKQSELSEEVQLFRETSYEEIVKKCKNLLDRCRTQMKELLQRIRGVNKEEYNLSTLASLTCDKKQETDFLKNAAEKTREAEKLDKENQLLAGKIQRYQQELYDCELAIEAAKSSHPQAIAYGKQYKSVLAEEEKFHRAAFLAASQEVCENIRESIQEMLQLAALKNQPIAPKFGTPDIFIVRMDDRLGVKITIAWEAYEGDRRLGQGITECTFDLEPLKEPCVPLRLELDHFIEKKDKGGRPPDGQEGAGAGEGGSASKE